MACTVSCSRVFVVRCSASPSGGGGGGNAVRVNGAAHRAPLQVGAALETSINRSLAELSPPLLPLLPTDDAGEERSRQNIPTEKQTVDPFRQALIVEGGVRYQQTLVVRSYEVGPDKTATLETVLNLLQETALNHVWMSGLLGDGFGATHGMIRNNLIWVVSRMHVQVDQYPIWGEVLDIDTWVGSSGKNGMRRDWLIRGRNSGDVFVRATSTWVMMNKVTRRLSKMPEEVRAEIAPWFIDRHAIYQEEATDKIIKLDSNAMYVDSDLKPKRSDLDMNHHVNNVKYVRWMLETLPDHFQQQNQLSSIILEYRKECGSSDVVQSICQPDDDSIPPQEDVSMAIGPSLSPELISGHHSLAGALQHSPMKYTHLLQLKAGDKYEEIVRGRTTWKKKSYKAP
ncbi:Palmitoyl-acyl carrier protein thioesterase, chloroplastic [Zea mays]|uniref:Acyl-[acyl-carrier-protein] hydrolase n=1 Tax=Zea mays TaxID=4577 RepID=A0A3L6G8P0_MAIZE|nr:palmitoyl-acyl carrier protein thioesterase, chloroplastic [Zea mays]PWZ44912.1 Palmitoyl-acyl carrier protein thioesterase, chloroplastic [Zea mays]|eukprot:XP_008663720.1 palmitoyl-acyl carrier protein thioesterase, chloroplastic [Zea mays]